MRFKFKTYWYMPHIRCWSNQTIDDVLELIIPTHIKISLKVHVNWMTKDERSFSSNGNIFLVWVIFIWTRCNNLKCFVQPLSLERLFQVNINNRTQHCILPSDIATLIPYPYIFLFDIKKTYLLHHKLFYDKNQFSTWYVPSDGRSALVLFSVWSCFFILKNCI